MILSKVEGIILTVLKFKAQTHVSAYNHKSKIHDKGSSQNNQKRSREIKILVKIMQ